MADSKVKIKVKVKAKSIPQAMQKLQTAAKPAANLQMFAARKKGKTP